MSGQRSDEFVTGPAALGQAMERYHNDAEFHARVYAAVQVVLGELESTLGGFRRSPLSINIATEAAAVALHIAAGYFAAPAPEPPAMSGTEMEADLSRERVPCPDCGGRGKIIGTVSGVPASVCTKYVTCERCWPRNDDGTKKFWNDGTAGTIPAEHDERRWPTRAASVRCSSLSASSPTRP